MRSGSVDSVFVMFLIGIGVGVVAGFINGTIVSFGRVLPIIVTLGMTYLARGLIPMDFIHNHPHRCDRRCLSCQKTGILCACFIKSV